MRVRLSCAEWTVWVFFIIYLFVCIWVCSWICVGICAPVSMCLDTCTEVRNRCWMASLSNFFFNSGVYLWSWRSCSPLLGWKLVSSSNPSLLSLPTSISVLQLQGCPGDPACFRGAKIQALLLTIAQQGLWNIDPSLWYLLLFIFVSVFKVIFVVQSHWVAWG